MTKISAHLDTSVLARLHKIYQKQNLILFFVFLYFFSFVCRAQYLKFKSWLVAVVAHYSRNFIASEFKILWMKWEKGRKYVWPQHNEIIYCRFLFYSLWVFCFFIWFFVYFQQCSANMFDECTFIARFAWHCSI